MRHSIFISTGPTQTRKIGENLAKKSLKTPKNKKTLVFGLVGDLGGGKTTFLQGFAKGLGIKEKILSPTFVLIRRYDKFYHIDCYRIQKPKELLDIGFKEIISGPGNIVAIEWSDKIEKILPKTAIMIRFIFVEENTRKITVSAP